MGNVTYGYDADGQRIAEGGTLVHATLPAAQSGNVYNADNQLTTFGGTAYNYDPDGNLLSDGTNSYNWNARGQLGTGTGPSGISTLGYDPGRPADFHHRRRRHHHLRLPGLPVDLRAGQQRHQRSLPQRAEALLAQASAATS